MLKKPKTKQTVAEKIAEIISHPNESSDSESADGDEARVTEFDEDEYQMPEARSTEFRKRNVKLLSEQSSKYKGKIASRKDFEQDESDGEEEDELEDDEEGDVEEDEEDEQENDSLKDDEDSEEQYEDTENEDDDDDDEEEEEKETEIISKVNRDAEIQKGACVQNQLHLWERLLELRINSQKILTKTNQLPVPAVLKALQTSDDKCKSTVQETTKHTQQLLQTLLVLQDTLFSQYSELKKNVNPTLKRPSPFKQNNANEEPPLKQVNAYLQERFESLRSYRNAVLLKWDDRTKLLQPGAGAKKKSMNEEYDIIKKIDNTLMNKSVLIQKSQQTKSNQQQQINEEDTEDQEGNADLNRNIYDDSDFYHQQLRELIEYKANTSNNMSEVTKQFVELQKLRQKMKKKVDTRASKGRKLRYVVHNKLINFMAPNDISTWTNESRDELSKSLFV